MVILQHIVVDIMKQMHVDLWFFSCYHSALLSSMGLLGWVLLWAFIFRLVGWKNWLEYKKTFLLIL